MVVVVGVAVVVVAAAAVVGVVVVSLFAHLNYVVVAMVEPLFVVVAAPSVAAASLVAPHESALRVEHLHLLPHPHCSPSVQPLPVMTWPTSALHEAWYWVPGTPTHSARRWTCWLALLFSRAGLVSAGAMPQLPVMRL